MAGLGARRWMWVVSVLVALLHAGQASADPREDAIALADQGSKRLENKDYAGAIEKFDAAFALVAVPVFALQSASALEMSGRLVEALSRYRAVYEMSPDASWSRIQHEAQASARERHQRLAARMPRLIVTFGGGRADRVELDGKETSEDALASGILVDPGEHRVAARAGSRTAEQLVALAEGQTRQIELVLPSSQERAAAPSDSAPRPVSPTEPALVTRDSSSTARTLGWVALGVGAAGIVVGSVSGFIALGKKSDLDERCPNRNCLEPQWEENDSYDRMRTLSTIGFVVGGVGIAAGGVLLWTNPSSSSSGAARLQLRAAPGRVTFAGAF